MPAIGSTERSRSGLVLVIAATGVATLHVLVVGIAETQSRAEIQADVQSVANAVAVGSVADLPKGAVAVIRAAGRIIGSQKPGSLVARYGQQEIQIGHWDASGQSFSTAGGKPNAVRITMRIRNEQGLFATFLGGSEHQIEAHAVAVLNEVDHNRRTTLVSG
jgi:hypothetical protein